MSFNSFISFYDVCLYVLNDKIFFHCFMVYKALKQPEKLPKLGFHFNWPFNHVISLSFIVSYVFICLSCILKYTHGESPEELRKWIPKITLLQHIHRGSFRMKPWKCGPLKRLHVHLHICILNDAIHSVESSHLFIKTEYCCMLYLQCQKMF